MTNATPPEPPRRNFFKKFLAVIVGGVVTAVPAAAAVLVFLDPVRRKRGTSEHETAFVDHGTYPCPADVRHSTGIVGRCP